MTACLPGLSPLAPVPCQQGTVCVSSKLRLAERRQQRLREVQARRDHLCEELAETQGRLMVEPGRWLEQCECPPPCLAAGPLPPRVPALQPPSCRGGLLGQAPVQGLGGAWLPLAPGLTLPHPS